MQSALRHACVIATAWAAAVYALKTLDKSLPSHLEVSVMNCQHQLLYSQIGTQCLFGTCKMSLMYIQHLWPTLNSLA